MTIKAEGLTPLLQVFDMPRSVAFYRDVLGFEVVTTSPPRGRDDFDWGLFRLDGFELMLNTAYEADRRPPQPEDSRVAAHDDTAVYIACRDVDGAYSLLRERGVAAEAPSVAPYGMKQLYLKDPDGYVICLQWAADGATPGTEQKPGPEQAPTPDALQIAVEMNEHVWTAFQKDMADIAPEEIDWRPAPEANSVRLIVRHLLIEARGHVARLGRHDDSEASADAHEEARGLDLATSMRDLETLQRRFAAGLRKMAAAQLRDRSSRAYEGKGAPPHFLAFHMATHLARHWGQVCAIRNLYRRSRGQRERFFPDNPTFPRD